MHVAMLNGGEHNVAASSSLSSRAAVAPRVDHVLVDLNCTIHSCFGRDAATTTKRGVIEAVLQRLRVLLTRVVSPSLSLIICIDGPAPYAKLHTQGLRRWRVALLDTCSAQQLTSLAVILGSLFLVGLENALAAQFKLRGGCGFLPHYVPVFLHGSTVVGEGEANIARALAHIATTAISRGCSRYNPNHTVTMIGNDIDLTLTCMGTTQYHNLFVVGPSSMQLINVSELLYRWLHSGMQQGAGEFRLTAEELASVRVDFVFLFLLNGGDHYAGAGEVAHVLWKRYRTVRAASWMQRALVAPDLSSVDVDFLADVLQASDYAGDAEVAVGMELLQATLWLLQTTVTGVCPDYQCVPAPVSPHLNHARAAVAHCQKRGQGISFPPHNSNRRDAKGPLTPLETFVALMPTESALPGSVAEALRSSRKHEQVVHALLTSNDASTVATAAQQAVAISDSHLSVSEQYLRGFTTPVQLNVLQPAKRLSRYEQHRMLSTGERITRAQPMPLVERITLPESPQYVDTAYPLQVKDLIFLSPFDRVAGTSSSEALEHRGANGNDIKFNNNKGVTDDPSLCYAATPFAVNKGGNDNGDDDRSGGATKGRCRRQRTKLIVRRIPVRVEPLEWEPSAPQRLQQTLEKAAALRMPEGRDTKTLRRLKKKLNAHRQLDVKEMRNGETPDEASRHMLRRKDKAFLAEIRQFLGEDGGGVISLLQDDSSEVPTRDGKGLHKTKQTQRGGGEKNTSHRKRPRQEETAANVPAGRAGDHNATPGAMSENKKRRREATRQREGNAAAATRNCKEEKIISANGKARGAKRRRKG